MSVNIREADTPETINSTKRSLLEAILATSLHGQHSHGKAAPIRNAPLQLPVPRQQNKGDGIPKEDIVRSEASIQGVKITWQPVGGPLGHGRILVLDDS